MWPFSNRGSRAGVNHSDERVLAILPRDLSVFARNDACIKLWLPEKLAIAVDQLSLSTETSRPDVLRWLFFEHIYGRPALNRLSLWKKEQDEIERRKRQLQSDMPSLSLSPVRTPVPSARSVNAQLLGKSVEDFKLWLPEVIKVELERLAKAEHHGLSDYLRKVLIRLLLGEVFYVQWSQAIGQWPNSVKQFETDSSPT